MTGATAQEVKTKLLELVARNYALTPLSMAREFGVSKSTVQRAIGRGSLTHFRFGNQMRIRPERIPLELVEAWAGETNAIIERWPEGRIAYFLHGVEGFVKIGFTGDFARRALAIQPGCPEPLQLLAYTSGGRATEREYHRRFAVHRAHGEWFRRSPAIDAEIVRLNEERLSCGTTQALPVFAL